jgi:hypothetical protein
MRWLLITAITRQSHPGVSKRKNRHYVEDEDGHGGSFRKHGYGVVTLRR